MTLPPPAPLHLQHYPHIYPSTPTRQKPGGQPSPGRPESIPVLIQPSRPPVSRPFQSYIPHTHISLWPIHPPCVPAPCLYLVNIYLFSLLFIFPLPVCSYSHFYFVFPSFPTSPIRFQVMPPTSVHAHSALLFSSSPNQFLFPPT